MAEEKTNTTTGKVAEKTAAVKLNKRIGNTTYRLTMHLK